MFCEFIDMYSNSIVSSLFMTATTKLQSLNVKWIVQQWYIPLNSIDLQRLSFYQWSTLLSANKE